MAGTAQRNRFDGVDSAGFRSRFFTVLLLLAALAVCAQDRFDPARLAEMDKAVDRAISEHRLPGGVLWVECNGSNYHKAFGQRAVAPSPEPMTEDTIFDIASMTKVLATTPALMVLYEQSKLKFDEPVAAYLPEFKGQGKDAITVRNLMTHTSGFGRSLRRDPDWYNFKRTFELICAEKPAHPPGTNLLYSDLNFIILGELVQRVSGMKLDEFVAREIFTPLKMTDTCFLPPASRHSRIAPTEKIGRNVLRGTVHDFKAQGMGGVAGHAGVFTTAADTARFARMILNEGELDGVRLFKPDTIKLITSVQTPPAIQAKRGLGWDIDSDFSRPRGDVYPVGSFGHTGFTGVCLWIDPSSKSFWMLLSNRVHPTPSENIYALQRELGTLAAQSVGARPSESATDLKFLKQK